MRQGALTRSLRKICNTLCTPSVFPAIFSVTLSSYSLKSPLFLAFPSSLQRNNDGAFLTTWILPHARRVNALTLNNLSLEKHVDDEARHPTSKPDISNAKPDAHSNKHSSEWSPYSLIHIFANFASFSFYFREGKCVFFSLLCWLIV